MSEQQDRPAPEADAEHTTREPSDETFDERAAEIAAEGEVAETAAEDLTVLLRMRGRRRMSITIN
jgi:hypothetical protein